VSALACGLGDVITSIAAGALDRARMTVCRRCVNLGRGGPRALWTIFHAAGSVPIGRSRACDLVVTARDVSGQHAVLQWTGQHWQM